MDLEKWGISSKNKIPLFAKATSPILEFLVPPPNIDAFVEL